MRVDKRVTRNRKPGGQYDYENLDLMCTCGHRLSVHAALNETKKRPCFNEDSGIDGATGKECKCKNFKKK